MKRRYVLAFVLTALAGTGLHFLYDLWPNPLFGLIAPVNESVWEHLKLLFWPFLAVSWYLARHTGNFSAAGAHLSAALLMPLWLLGVYYLLRSGFGITGLAVDIALYYLTLAAGFVYALAHRNAPRFGRAAGTLAMLTAIWASCLLVFSIAAPDFPIFWAET